MNKVVLVLLAALGSTTTIHTCFSATEVAITAGGPIAQSAFDTLWNAVYSRVSDRGFFKKCELEKDECSEKRRINAALGFGQLAVKNRDKTASCIKQLESMKTDTAPKVRMAVVYAIQRILDTETLDSENRKRAEEIINDIESVFKDSFGDKHAAAIMSASRHSK